MVKVRIAPSPTGKLHLGTARTALFNYLFAKKEEGKFVLRFEDTDRSRSTKEYEKDIVQNLKWLGLDWDEGPVYQMERLKIYEEYAQKLFKQGLAKIIDGAILFEAKNALKYLRISCTETQRLFKRGQQEHKDRRAYFVKNIASDLIHGPVSGLVSDTVLLRSDGLPTFHLAVVVDDGLMKITHVIRGDDHLSNTPLHVVLKKALGFKTPLYAHLPLILAPDKKKMSKRSGAVAVADYKKMGYLPEALVNYLAFLGFAGREKEIVSLDELVKTFNIKKVQKSPAVFYQEKLDWLNGRWIRRLSSKELTSRIHKFGHKKVSEKMVTLIQPRLKTLADVPFWTDFFFCDVDYDKKLLIGELKNDLAKKILENWLKKEITFKKEQIKKRGGEIAGVLGLNLAETTYPLRIAIAGAKVSPPLFESMEILGKEICLKRIKKALIKVK